MLVMVADRGREFLPFSPSPIRLGSFSLAFLPAEIGRTERFVSSTELLLPLPEPELGREGGTEGLPSPFISPSNLAAESVECDREEDGRLKSLIELLLSTSLSLSEELGRDDGAGLGLGVVGLGLWSLRLGRGARWLLPMLPLGFEPARTTTALPLRPTSPAVPGSRLFLRPVFFFFFFSAAA